jgi:UDP-N-acetylmuramyl pentapeptide phosphotransferase/UDP-N-acetylglucosamine-1-phosphate transferase
MNIIILFLAAITAFLLVYYSIPMIIRIANNKQLFDSPDNDRKLHLSNTPNLGGVSIFLSVILAYLCWNFAFEEDVKVHFIIAALIILFFTGIRDDLNAMRATQKLLLQILAASVIIFGAELRVTHFFGILGFHDIPYWFSICFTYFLIIVIINAVNLIDGIDGLAAGLSAIISTTFGVWFYLIGLSTLCFISFLHAAALIAFLRFNFSNNPKLKIFMGDSGSMVVGGILSVCTLRFLETCWSNPIYFLEAGPGIAVAILIIPLFDTLRVFVIRILQGHSPFRADRNHLHHLLLNLGLTHRSSSFIMYGINIIYIIGAFIFKDSKPTPMLLTLFFSCLILLNILPFLLKFLLQKMKHNKYIHHFIKEGHSISRESAVFKGE